jgi:hypothetical protein
MSGIFRYDTFSNIMGWGLFRMGPHSEAFLHLGVL